MGKYKLVLRRKIGLFWHVALVANHGTGIEETVMTSEKYYSKSNAQRAQKALSDTLNVEVA